MVTLRGSVNPMTPPSPYADLMAQRRPLQKKHTVSSKHLKFTSIRDKRDNCLPIYQMVQPRGSVNPMTPHSPYADLMDQKRPLQTKHTFTAKLEVHFYMG